MADKQPDMMEMMAMMQKMQQPASPPQTAVTIQGINKYWPQILGAVALGWFLVGQGKEQEKLMGRVATIEKSQEDLTKVKEGLTETKTAQLKASGEVQELRNAVNAITASQAELSKKFDGMANDVRAVGQQISSISQAMRSR